MVKKTVNVSIEAKSGHIKMYSVELNRLIFFIVDYVNQDTLYANFRRYSRLAQMRTAGLRLVQSARSALETLSVSVKSITAVIYGYTYKRRKDMKADYKFPPTDFSFILPKFGLSYDNSKPNVSASTLTLG
ncbi:MAG: hypothetical protein P4M11_13050 [Candidatus Pacebacteria bacterium]|nr:hypothetical protein [Candidatus Paceibacterota bacterium]